MPGLLPIAPGVSLETLLRSAGGMTREADSKNIELLREAVSEQGNADTIRKIFDLEKATAEPIQTGDMLLVPKRYTMRESGMVRVAGEVLKPGNYDIWRGERLSQVLIRAGGLTPFAYAYGAVFQRARVKEEKRLYYQRAGIEMQNSVLMMVARQKRTAAGGTDPNTFAAMKGLSEELKKVEPSGRVVVEADPAVLQVHPELDVVLEPGDEIVIPKRPSHVVVIGEVLNPGAVQFRSGLRAEDYLRAAGGVGMAGDEGRTYMILPNGSAQPLKVASWNAQPTPVPPGSVIYVPRDPLPLDNTALFQTVLEMAKDIALAAAALYGVTK
jgi:protein involved in polysaccharide export with SLBB domain